MVTRLLIANRGEIARRIQRTCRRVGVTTVAVFSDADAGEPHVREADQAVRLGPAPAPESYLDADRLLAVAAATGCDAVHPGYGFLAEDAAFAERVADVGLTFLGPSPAVIALMGDKAAAKSRLRAAGVPVIPGTDRADLDDAALMAAAAELGAPLMVKAVAGGGGTGLRIVHHLDDLAGALTAARREARGAFGDDRIILERAIDRPRHIEVQVVADAHGNVLHLHERECSVQRRHQKLVEEAPSACVDEALRARLAAAAVTATREVGYLGVGTLEFLVDGTTLTDPEPRFHFLEMNTRLQVEHPVTEEITGLDLVELQLSIADGAPLPLTQDEVARHGHAIEVRLYAEDPVAQLPQTGRVHALSLPRGPGVRTEVGIAAGSEVTRHYDPMLGKLIAHGPDRATALARLRVALADTSVRGVVTNLELLDAVLAHPAFAAGELTTAFLDEHLPGWHPAPLDDEVVAAAATALHETLRGEPAAPPRSRTGQDLWRELGAVRTGGGAWHLQLADPAADTLVELAVRRRGGRIEVRRRAPGGGEEPAALRPAVLRDLEVVAGPVGWRIWCHLAGVTRVLDQVPAVRHGDATVAPGGAAFTAPMPGTVIDVAVAPGQVVTAGAVLVVVEAMKMEHAVRAPTDGTVTAVEVRAGQAVEAGATLLAFSATASAAGAAAADGPRRG